MTARKMPAQAPRVATEAPGGSEGTSRAAGTWEAPASQETSSEAVLRRLRDEGFSRGALKAAIDLACARRVLSCHEAVEAGRIVSGGPYRRPATEPAPAIELFNVLTWKPETINAPTGLRRHNFKLFRAAVRWESEYRLKHGGQKPSEKALAKAVGRSRSTIKRWRTVYAVDFEAWVERTMFELRPTPAPMRGGPPQEPPT